MYDSLEFLPLSHHTNRSFRTLRVKGLPSFWLLSFWLLSEYVTTYEYFETLTKNKQGISFFVGFVSQDIKLALYIGLAGTALTFLVVVPPWPFFKQHPVQWLLAAGSQSAAEQAALAHGITVDGEVVA